MIQKLLNANNTREIISTIFSFDRVLEQDREFAEDLSESEESTAQISSEVALPFQSPPSPIISVEHEPLMDYPYTREVTHNDYYTNVTIEPNNHQPSSTPDINLSLIPEREIFQSYPVSSIPRSPDNYLTQSPYTTSTPLHPSPPRPCCSYIPTPPQLMCMSAQRCIVCEAECTSAHKCPGCNNPIHTTCGHSVDGMEGYGCLVWCVTCWVEYRSTNIQQGRLKAKRGQEKQIQRMFQQSNKKIKLAEAHQNILIPIPALDRRSPFDPQNLPGVILEVRDDGMYRVGTAAGILDSLYISSQFQPSLSPFLTAEEVPDKQVTLREAILHSSFGKHRLQCNCTGGCNSNRCKCRKSKRTCNSKCHKSLACHNKTE